MSLQQSYSLKDQIHLKAGEYRQVFQWDARASFITEKPCLLLLLWPKEKHGWLKIRLHAVPSDTDRAKLTNIDLSGSSNTVDLDTLVARHRRGQGFKDVLATKNFLCLQWYPGLPLEIEFIVDSNHPDLKKLSDTRIDANGPLVAQIEVLAFSPSIPAGEQGSIGISLRPCKPLPPFDGCVAVDLGNSSSSMVAFRFGSLRMTDILELNSDEGVSRTTRLAEQSNPVESVLRIDEIQTLSGNAGTNAQPNPTTTTRVFGQAPFHVFDETNPMACSFVIGKTARQGGLGSNSNKLIFGSKRLLQKKNTGQFITRMNNKDWRINRQLETPVQFENHHPAEFILSKMFRNFSGSVLAGGNVAGFPKHLAVTYPTTYDRHEIEKLRKTVTRAWLRFMGVPQTELIDPLSNLGSNFGAPTKMIAEIQKSLHSNKVNISDSDDQPHPLVPLMIDEATAAAFYFLYERIFEFAGGLSSFSYIYPNGITLLLYDCGGGTTDIALVNAKLDPAREDRLLLKVLGRTGDGNFGGDTITEAVCKLMKAKISEVILKSNNEPKVPTLFNTKPATIAESHKAVTAYIADIAKLTPADNLLPTKFDPNADIPDLNAKTNMVELWQWAEDIKKALNGPKNIAATSAPKLINYDPVTQEISGVQIGLKISFDPSKGGLAKIITSKFDDKDTAEVVKKLERIEIKRSEVDALIHPVLQTTINRSNNLLRKKIESVTQSENIPHLDYLVVSGNGGRYPLVNEMLSKELIGVDIDDKKAIIPVEDLKDAVAKGAVLFLNCMKEQGRARVDFDTKLSDCIPFDIGWLNNETNIIRVVFEEGLRYSKMKEEEIQVFSQTENSSINNQITILRRYPGEEEQDKGGPGSHTKGFKSYLTFVFKEPIQGNIFIRFDAEKNIFTARDATNQEPEKTINNEPNDSFLSPIERGNI